MGRRLHPLRVKCNKLLSIKMYPYGILSQKSLPQCSTKIKIGCKKIYG